MASNKRNKKKRSGTAVAGTDLGPKIARKKRNSTIGSYRYESVDSEEEDLSSAWREQLQHSKRERTERKEVYAKLLGDDTIITDSLTDKESNKLFGWGANHYQPLGPKTFTCSAEAITEERKVRGRVQYHVLFKTSHDADQLNLSDVQLTLQEDKVF
jgi:hypothetical protein